MQLQSSFGGPCNCFSQLLLANFHGGLARASPAAMALQLVLVQCHSCSIMRLLSSQLVCEAVVVSQLAQLQPQLGNLCNLTIVAVLLGATWRYCGLAGATLGYAGLLAATFGYGRRK